MFRRVLSLVLVAVFCFSVASFAQEASQAAAQGASKDRIIAVATAAVKAKGYTLDDVSIVYDDGNKLWQEQIGKMTELVNSPNFGIFQKGFMQNYRTIYFDFKEPFPDLWVFVDKDTGDVLEVFVQQ